MDNRRSFLHTLGAAPMAALGSTPMATSAIKEAPISLGAQQSTSIGGALGPPEFLGTRMRAGLLGVPNSSGPRDWKSAKQLIYQTARSTFPADDPIHHFVDSIQKSFDEIARDAVIDAGGKVTDGDSPSKLRYEPQLYEMWLKSAASLLDRCLIYRREMGEFEINATKVVFDYVAFATQNPIRRKLLELGDSSDIERIKGEAEALATTEFAKAQTSDRSSHGHAKEAEGAAKIANRSESKQVLRAQLSSRQFELTTESQLAQFTRYVSPGSASNYAERYQRMAAFLVDDLGDAYRKIYCASVGIAPLLDKMGLGFIGQEKMPLAVPRFSTASDAGTAVRDWVSRFYKDQPHQDSRNILDALVLWVRAVLRELERIGQYESEVSLSIPLSQTVGPGKTKASILSFAVIAAELNRTGSNDHADVARFPFKLTEEALPNGVNLQNPRIVGIGLTVISDDYTYSPFENSPLWAGGNQTTGIYYSESTNQRRLARVNATIQTPPQSVKGIDAYRRSPVFLPNVRLQGAETFPQLSTDSACRNVSPFGDWMILLDRNQILWHFGGSNSELPQKGWIQGFVLHLKLRVSAKSA